MSKAKKRNYYAAPRVATSVPRERKKIDWRKYAVPHYVLLFVVLWIFGTFVYGDVFHMSQQFSYFACNKTLMAEVLNQDGGLLNAAGCFLLLSYHYPAFGAAVLALMLAVSAWLLDYVLGFGSKLRWIATLLPFAFLGYFVALDYSVNYVRETSILMSYPAVAMLVLALVAAVKRVAFRKKAQPLFRVPQNDSTKFALLTNGVIVLAFAGLTTFCVVERDNIVRTCKMQRALERADWQEMIDVALSAKEPARSVVAYYALALLETGQLENRLFEIPFNYPKTRVKSPGTKENDGVVLYSVDCDFYAGLVNTSYHEAMESYVRNGAQVFYLKRLARAAAMNGEAALCKKYLNALGECPFEGDFVERYSVYANDMKKMYDEPEFAHVAAKMPVLDVFEQNLRAPYFIGYNVSLGSGRTLEALRTSIMACLYAKDTEFMQRITLLRNSELSAYQQQAVVLQGLRVPAFLQGFNFDQTLVKSRMRSFINDAKPYMTDKKMGFEKLKGTWLNYYPFYLYFQNLPQDKKEEQQDNEKGGVN